MKKLSVDLSLLVSAEGPGGEAAAWPREPKTETGPETGQVINNVDKSGGMPGLLPGREGKTNKEINHNGRIKMNKKQKFIVFALSVLMAFGLFQLDSYAGRSPMITVTVQSDDITGHVENSTGETILEFGADGGSCQVFAGSYTITWTGGQSGGGSRTSAIQGNQQEISWNLQ